MATGVVTWSKTSATNATADSSVNFAEGQAPSSVNDSARGLMASAAKWRDDINGSLVTTGGTTAYVLATNQTFAALTAGYQVAFQMNATNTGTTTLNVDSLGAKPLRSAAGVELLAGSLLIGATYRATYFTSNSGEWLVESYPVLGDAQIAAAKLASNSVTTAKITDANVTLAKLDNLATKTAIGRNTGSTGVPEAVTAEQILNWIGTAARGDILYQGASNILRLAKGTSGQVLTQGANDPSWTTNGRTLINTLTASNSAALQDTTSMTSTYKFYDIELLNIVPATLNVQLSLQVYSGGAYKSTGYQSRLDGATSSSGSISNTATTSILIGGASAGNADPGTSGIIKAYDPSTNHICSFVGSGVQVWSNVSASATFTTGGYWATAGVVTGFQILASSGNITSGTVRIYGYN